MRLYTLQNNRYKIQAILGQGGYGITYLAEQTTLGRQVAIKEFFMKDYCGRAAGSPEVTLGTDGSREMLLRYREKFKKEAATLARLNHPNIVRVIDMFEENNTYYYVMEYADGPSLSQIIKAQGKLPIDEALAMIKQVADAVSYLHQEHLCHYDIKPANILTSKKGQVILADFGLAKQYDEQGEETSTTPVGKSKGFAPPEQYRVGGVSDFSPETDIYALAATLYKLLTGITPIESLSRDDEEIDFSILPAALITPIRKAMNLKRKKRFHSVEEFMDTLPETESQSMSDNEVINQDNNAVESSNDVSQTEDTDLVINAPRPAYSSSEKSVREEKKTTIDWQKYLAPIGITAVLLIMILIWANKDTEPTTDPIAGTDTTRIEEPVTPPIENPKDTLIPEEPTNNSATSGNNTAETDEKPEKEEAQKLSPLEQAKKKYKRVWGFREGMAVVVTHDEKQGYINRNGEEVIPCKYDDAIAFFNGLGEAYIGDKKTFVNKGGKEVIPLDNYEKMSNYTYGYIEVVLNGKKGIYDYNGKLIVPFKYEDVRGYEDNIMAVKLNGEWGFVDKSGKTIISFKFQEAYGFNDGLAEVEENGKSGMIDKQGNIIIPFKYEALQPYSEGLIGAELNGKWGFINRNDQIVIPFTYDWVLTFEKGKAQVRKDGEDYYIDKNEKMVGKITF